VDDESLSAAGITIDDGAGYTVQMTPSGALTVGAGGLSASTTSTTGAANPVFNIGITLGASQQWSIDGGPAGDGVTFAAQIAGDPDALTVNLSHGGYLAIQNHVGTSGFTAQGTDASHTGAAAGLNGQIDAESPSTTLNSSGNSVAINDAVLADTSVGTLTITGGQLTIGSGSCCMTYPTLSVAGALTLDSASDTQLLVGPPRTVVGIGMVTGGNAQIAASGNVSLNGTLDLQNLGPNGCVGLTPGDPRTLISTPGTLGGAFSNAPDGSTITFQCGPPGAQATGTIHYNPSATPRTVTVQIVSSPATSTTTLTATPPTASTNQPVMLTATVSATSGVPAGTVEFDSGGVAIAGCSAQPLSAGAPYTASCLTSFPQASSPCPTVPAVPPCANPVVTARFNSATTTLYGSSSGPVNLTVLPAATTTAVSASAATAPTGSIVAYTSTVTPTYPGAGHPTGSVTFMDGNSPIPGCSTLPLTGSSSSTATGTCTASYPSPGIHTVTARYNGDSNFQVSVSTARTVTVLRTASAAQLKALLAGLIAPHGKAAKIAAILKAGGYTLRMTMPEAGTASVNWYALRRGAHLSVAKQTLIASGTARFNSAGTKTLKLTLSPSGRKLLRSSKCVRLTGKATFTPSGQAPLSALRAFTLRR
jgi:hypothetical protein